MKQIARIFVVLLLLLMVFGIIFLTGTIYDTSRRQTTETYFFQSNPFSNDRPGTPRALDQISDGDMLDLLIGQYVREYFYVLPYSQNVEMRTKSNSPLAYMSTNAVFNDWVKNVSPKLSDLAEDGVMRTVSFIGAFKSGDYYDVSYKLNTWSQSNNLSEPPVTTSGRMLLGIAYWGGLREGVTTENLAAYFKSGGNLIAIFDFIVTSVELVE